MKHLSKFFPKQLFKVLKSNFRTGTTPQRNNCRHFQMNWQINFQTYFRSNFQNNPERITEDIKKQPLKYFTEIFWKELSMKFLKEVLKNIPNFQRKRCRNLQRYRWRIYEDIDERVHTNCLKNSQKKCVHSFSKELLKVPKNTQRNCQQNSKNAKMGKCFNSQRIYWNYGRKGGLRNFQRMLIHFFTKVLRNLQKHYRMNCSSFYRRNFQWDWDEMFSIFWKF